MEMSRLGASQVGPLPKGASSFLFSMVLADTKVHHAACLLLERDAGNEYVWKRESNLAKEKVNHAEERQLQATLWIIKSKSTVERQQIFTRS